MNKEMIESENFVTVLNDNCLNKRERTNNIIEILKTENNIEELEEINKQKNYLNFVEVFDNILTQYINKLMSLTLPISLIIAVIISVLQILPFLAAILGIPVLSSMFTLFISAQLSTKKTNRIFNDIKLKQEKLLNNELDKQKQNLKELNEKAISDKSYDVDIIGKVQKIEKTELIDNLKRKLELIKDYELKKKEYIEYSKDYFISPKLRDNGYSESDINFMQMLMKEDLKLEKENKTQKTLKLEKK